MAHTVFVDGSTITANRIVAAWLNDADTVTYVRFGDGTSYTGNLTVPGTTALTGALTYGGVTLSNSVTGTGSMMLSASPTTTGTLTAAAINASGNGSFGPGGSASAQTTITANGSSANTYGPGIYLQRNSVSKGVLATESQLAANNSDNIWLYAYAGASLKLYGGGNLGQTIDASGNVTMPGTLGVTGRTDLSSYFYITSNLLPTTSSNGVMGVVANHSHGAVIQGKGSVNDSLFLNSAGSAWIQNPTGTVNVNMPGTLGVTGTATMAAINASGAIGTSASVTITKTGSGTYGAGPYMWLNDAGNGILQQLNAAYGIDWRNQATTILATMSNTGAMQFNSTLGVTGLLTASGGLKTDVAPSTAWGIDQAQPNQLVTIADNGTYDLSTGGGLVVVTNNTTGSPGFFLLSGGVTTVISDPSGVYTGASGTAAKTNVYWNGSTAYRIQNKTGGSVDYYIATIKTRGSG